VKTDTQLHRVPVTDDGMERWLRMADDAAGRWPDQYQWFLSKCKHEGISGAVASIISSDKGIIMLWAFKVRAEHPEIRK